MVMVDPGGAVGVRASVPCTGWDGKFACTVAGMGAAGCTVGFMGAAGCAVVLMGACMVGASELRRASLSASWRRRDCRAAIAAWWAVRVPPEVVVSGTLDWVKVSAEGSSVFTLASSVPSFWAG